MSGASIAEGGRLRAEDIEAMAAAMAAEVDARLGGFSFAPAPVAEPLTAPEPSVERGGLTEERIYDLMRALGDDIRPHAALAPDFGLTPDEVHRWCHLLLESSHAQGWPRIRLKIDAKKSRFAKGMDLEDHVNEKRVHTPTWRKNWRALWFLMRLYESPSHAAAEWSEPDPLGLWAPLTVPKENRR